jgi:hypothetical protein
MVGGWKAAFHPKTVHIAPKIALAAGAAAVIASSMTVFAGARDLSPRATFAERFAVAGPDCAVQNWPYIDSRCLRRQDGAPIRPIRIVAIDRAGN